jgi:hypothetical protein
MNDRRLCRWNKKIKEESKMVSQKTAVRIWKCYQEIETAGKLISDMEDALKNGKDPNPRDAFGRQKCLQLGVPVSSDGMRLFDVKPTLAMSIMRAHIANMQGELGEANEQARIEIDA